MRARLLPFKFKYILLIVYKYLHFLYTIDTLSVHHIIFESAHHIKITLRQRKHFKGRK